MRESICQSAQLTLIGNKFMFFQHENGLGGIPNSQFDLCPDQQT